MSLGSECKVPAGVLTVSLELYPPLSEPLSADVISTQVSTLGSRHPLFIYGEENTTVSSVNHHTQGDENLFELTKRAWLWKKHHFVFLLQQALERQRKAERERLFLVYAKQWWREFLDIRPSHQSKMVKIFAQVCVGANRGRSFRLVPVPPWSCLTISESVSAGRERRQQAGVFLRACPPGRPVAGEPSTRGALRQPAGAPESPGGGRRKHTGAVVHAVGFPVQTEGTDQSWWLICLSGELLHSRPGSSTGTTAQILMVPNSARNVERGTV